jgi:hypothetical protein
MPVTGGISIHDILIEHGYKLIDDGWHKEGRRTYLHDRKRIRRAD